MLLLRAVISRWLGRCYVTPRTSSDKLAPMHKNISGENTDCTSKFHNKSVHKKLFVLDLDQASFLGGLHFCLHIVLVCRIFLVYKYCSYCSNCYNIFKNENPGNHSFHTFAFYHIIHLVNTQNLIQCMSINFLCISIKNFVSNYTLSNLIFYLSSKNT